MYEVGRSVGAGDRGVKNKRGGFFAGIVVGEVTGMRVAERVEKSSGGVVSAAKLTLTGTLKLMNTSASQSVREHIRRPC